MNHKLKMYIYLEIYNLHNNKKNLLDNITVNELDSSIL